MKYWLPQENTVPHVDIVPAQRAAGTANGAGKDRKRARVLMVTLACGVVPSGSTVDVKLQGKDLVSGSWEDLVSSDSGSSTPVAFAQRTNGNSSAGSTLVGTIVCSELDYDEYRAVGVTVGASGAAYGVHFLFCDFPEVAPTDAVANAFALIQGVGARAATLTP